ncbi:hypothetical protein [Streptomyces agglomeratus]|uniref:hypothetical protein n=1 Tax=Streptomyces agglomeratus TaxID=285458 RepID=UPI000854F66D|nr:hypothetical protein [Streptomyces agglomeratus]OEJ36358.1 hypothetical protein BGK72_39035 [Streptomyces agglomeratus]
MTSSASWPAQRVFRSKTPEPYPFVGAPLEGYVLGYIAAKPSKGGDIPVFAFESGGAKECGLMEIRPDGTVVPAITDTTPMQMVTLNESAARTAPVGQPGPLRSPSVPVPALVLHTARALAAREAAVAGNGLAVEAFMTDVLGLWRGARWQEPVSTALLGDWVGSLHTDGLVDPGALDHLKADTRKVHQQLTPLWERKINGRRLWCLESALAGNLTAYDILVGGPDPYETLAGTLPDDPRVAAVLNRLTAAERAVAMAWADSQVTSWTEAASSILALAPKQFAGFDPTALGERVRRKLKRLGTRHTTLITAQGREQA